MSFFVFIGIFLLLSFAAYLSACETAITLASRAKFHHLSKVGNKRAKIIYELQNKLTLMIGAILACVTLINSLAASLTTAFVIESIGSKGLVIAPIALAFFTFVYCEVLPKMLALIRSEQLLLRSAYFLKMLCMFFTPLNTVINMLAKKILILFGIKQPSEFENYASLEELKGIIDLHQGPGSDVPHERAMLKSILDLDSVLIKEIMIHRKNVSIINASDSIENIIDFISMSPYTRFPVWKDYPENIIGVINAKTLLKTIRTRKDLSNLKIENICIKPWFVPESANLLEQLHAFRKRREHFAVVVDEYGDLMGIVTLEDILEEIVGNIDDEHDIKETYPISQDDGSIILEGDFSLRDLSRQFEWELPDSEASTLAGFLIHEIRLIPSVGQIFILHGFKFEILAKEKNQITSIRLTKIS